MSYDNWLESPFQESLACTAHNDEDCEICDPQYFICEVCGREHDIEELNNEDKTVMQCQSCSDRLEGEELC